MTFSASETGTKTDDSNTDVVTAGEDWAYQINGDTGFTITACRTLFDSDTSTTIISTGVQSAFSTASVTYYTELIIAGAPTASETARKSRFMLAGTLQNLAVYVSDNARTTNTVYTVRKNGADTAITVTYGSGETGLKEDTSNTATVASGDDINYSITTLAGTETITTQTIKIEFVNSTKSQIAVIGSGGATQAFNITTYHYINDLYLVGSTTEASAQSKLGIAKTWSNLTVNISANTIATSASTIKSRVNGANGNQSVSFAAAETGTKSDTSNSDNVLATDDISIQIITPNTSGDLTIGTLTSVLASLVGTRGYAVII